MSALPVYIWYPAQFVNSTAFIPDSLSEAENLVLVFEGKPGPKQVDTTPFVNLARHIAAAAQDGEHSEWFAEFYRDIETTLPELARQYAIVDVPESGTYEELMPLLAEYCPQEGLVLYDSQGNVWLPDGRELPGDEGIPPAVLALYRAKQEKLRREGPLPEKIKDFYKYMRPLLDALLGEYGYVHNEQLFNAEGAKRKAAPNYLFYEKPMAHGKQIWMIILIRRYTGVYECQASVYFSEDRVIDIRDAALNDQSKFNRTEGGGRALNSTFYLDRWFRIDGQQTDTALGIQTFLANWRPHVAEISQVHTYADVAAYQVRHGAKIIDCHYDEMRNDASYLLLITAYLDGARDLTAQAQQWLNGEHYFFVNKELTQERMEKVIRYLQDLDGTVY